MAGLIRIANDILTVWRLAGPGDPAIDLEAVFYEVVLPKSSGIACEIVYAPFESFEGLMALDEQVGKWRIGVSTNITYPPRRNFTLAHEIGHFIGHRNIQQRFECTFEKISGFEIDQLEVEANEFASHILMPPDVMRKYINGLPFNHESVTEISKTFKVSRAAAAYKWIHLTNSRVGFLVSRDGFVCHGRASDRLYRSGTFFRSGEEIPAAAGANELTDEGQVVRRECKAGIWNASQNCVEVSFATRQGGYVYTYLDFDNIAVGHG